jgi:predicted ABC-type sugar transport system permease subunit
MSDQAAGGKAAGSGVPAAMLTGLLFGVINGALIAYIRLPPPLSSRWDLSRRCAVSPAWWATT